MKPRTKTEPQRKKSRASSRPAAAKSPVVAIAAGALLIALTLAFYIPAMHAGYIWDDDVYVQKNEALRSAGGLWRIWFDLEASPQYYPLVYTSYWLEYHLWGDEPAGYHVVNILLHGLVAVLLWRFLKRLAIPAAWLVAAIFALHPVHVESVAWITERKNVLSGVFYFGAALLYLRFACWPADRISDARRWGYWAAALALLAAALLSKTVTCTLPAVLLLAIWWLRRRVSWKDAVPLLPFFVLGGALGLFTSWFEKHHTGALGAEWSMTFIERCLVAGRVLWFYIAKLVWPFELAFIYPRWTINAGAWWQYLFPLAAVAALLRLFLMRRRIGWGPLVAALCFAGTLFPALGFFNVYYMQYSFVADHWQYLASIAVIVLICSAIAAALRTRPPAWRRGGILAAIAVLAALGTLTWRQSQIYANLEGLWRDVLRKNPAAWMAHNNLGNLLKDSGRLEEARTEYEQAIAVRPDFAMAHSNLGIVFKRQGRIDDAVRQYRRAVECDPDYASAYYNLGIALQDRGDLDAAVAAYGQALERKPNHAEARVNLGWILMTRGQLDQAAEHFEAAVAARPNLAEAHLNLGIIRQNQGRPEQAAVHFSRAIELNPGLALAHFQLGISLAMQGKFDAAAISLREAVQLDPGNVEARRALDDVLARRGRGP